MRHIRPFTHLHSTASSPAVFPRDKRWLVHAALLSALALAFALAG